MNITKEVKRKKKKKLMLHIQYYDDGSYPYTLFYLRRGIFYEHPIIFFFNFKVRVELIRHLTLMTNSGMTSLTSDTTAVCVAL